MTTPTSPLEKKETIIEAELTDSERIKRLELTLERAYNTLGKEISELDISVAENFNRFQNEVTHAITMINASNLQSIITLKELMKLLVKNGTVDEKVLNEAISEEIKKAVAHQQQIVEQMRAAQEKAQAETATA